jgi:8-oxo-dGTP pyrophosphatase MutT (NUDIX family)
MSIVSKKGVDCVGVCVVFFCHDGKGKFLMGKRTVNTRDEHGKWDIGGGSIELHDEVLATLEKEIKEEYSTDILNHEFLGYRDVHRVHEGQKTHWIGLDFAVQIDPTKVINGEPHKIETLGWFTLDTIPNEVHSQFPFFLERYKSTLTRLLPL